MEKALQTLIDIKNCTGSGSQEQKFNYLRVGDSPALRELLQVAYNPYITTKITKVGKIEPKYFGEMALSDFQRVVSKLTSVKSATNDIRKMVSTFIYESHLSEEHKKIIINVLTKSLNIGLGIKSINKIYGGKFLPDIEPMLAETDDKKIAEWLKEYGFVYVEEKFDGVRMLIPIQNGEISFKTREFRDLDKDCLPSLSKTIKRFGLSNCFLDGEWTDLNRQTVSGRANKILKGNKEIQDEETIFNLFAINPIGTYYNEKPGFTYEQNRIIIKSLKKAHESSYINFVDSNIAKSLEEVKQLYVDIIKRGGEGVIVKRPKHRYIMKRSSDWLKKKEENICDLVIDDFFEGKGKREGKIGGFICKSSDNLLTVRVGGGFSDELINKVSEDPYPYVGKIVEIKYNIKSKDEKGNWSLFLPRLNGENPFRVDKTVANTLKEIK
ncbi:MAG TPA: hypothetical protein PKY56_03955 [Candidatus Kapabacteria bacterium]|nr:hypothetical protein [Candidatus Kapabacteria bacterium]